MFDGRPTMLYKLLLKVIELQKGLGNENET